MVLDPLAPVRIGLRIGIAVLRFELRVLEALVGEDGRDASAVVVVQAEPDVAPAPAAGVPTAPIPEPEAVPAEPEPEPVPPQPDAARPIAEPVAPRAQPETPAVPLEPDAPHIETEPELVGEFAEPGAEEGAGAEIHVEEPWAGYRQMRVADVRDRVAVAGAEELAIVQLYESTHRNRRSVLDAVERRTRELANRPPGR
jgi:hypothetical protein